MAKLLRKDVLKWLKNLKSGQYLKGKCLLVSNDGTRFCCLGVWADQHGATWAKNQDCSGTLIPIPKGMKKPQKDQGEGLLSGKLLLGLEPYQNDLTSLNDENSTFAEVINYIEVELLPKAK